MHHAAFGVVHCVRDKKLIDFVADVFVHADSSPEEARRIATYLTTANLT
eukprot:gene13907-18418_t